MTSDDAAPARSDTGIVAALADLRVTAPPGLDLRVLDAAGIADRYAVLDTTVGRVGVAMNAHGVSWVGLAGDEDAFVEGFVRTMHRPLHRGVLPPAVGRALERGGPGEVEADLRGRGAFERSVLDVTWRIPRGEVRSYGWIAREIGNPLAVRAVGTALARNPVPLLIPCHRVVRSDGHIGNYSLGGRATGPDRKRALLLHEGVDPAVLAR